MKRQILSAAFALSLCASSVAFARAPAGRPVPMPPPPPAQSVHYAGPVARADLRQLEEIADRLERARRTLNARQVRAIDAELQRYLASEMRERRVGSPADRRRDDAERRQLASIGRDLEKLERRMDRAGIAKREKLVSELIQLARAEARDDRRGRIAVARR